MDFFIKENTPAGFTIKIIPSGWQFIVFDKKGNSVDIYGGLQKFTYNIPIVIFVGSSFADLQDCDREYNMLKIRNGSLIIPYHEKENRTSKYVFAKSDIILDLVPVRIINKPSLSVMMREIDVKTVLDWVLVDDSITQSDFYIIEHRYNAKNIINTNKIDSSEEDRKGANIFYNLNFLSRNPVFLAASHLRSMDTASLSQLILDFELTPIDLEIIIRYMDEHLEGSISNQNRVKLADLRRFSNFYLQILLRNESQVNEVIESENNPASILYLSTLLARVKTIFFDSAGRELISGYEKKLDLKKQ